MGSRSKKLVSVLVSVLVVILAGCGSSSKSAGSASKGTYTLGVLTDQTGLLGPTHHTVPIGVKAAVGMFNAEGYHLKYVVADTTSSPAGVLVAAHKLVDEDHVFAVVALSGLTFAGAAFLTSKGVPVVGADEDGNEWITSRNMFSVYGTPNFAQVETTTGSILKLLGATNFAAIGYGISPSSAEAAKGSAASAQAAGIKVGYLNANFPFGGTNVGPAVLAMKNAGVDSFIADVEQSTSFAMIQALRQQGVPLKAALSATGYGGDLVSAGPATEQVAQGVYFTEGLEPVEMHTAATQRLVQVMQKYAGVPSDQITTDEALAYMSIDGFITGLKAAGANPTPASFMNAMLGIRSYDGAGLYGSHTVGFAMNQRGSGTAGADNCLWLVQWSGSSFHLIAGGEPICGTVIPGKTVSS
jgi:branched-chain amino acid transport system substrate-binding protein